MTLKKKKKKIPDRKLVCIFCPKKYFQGPLAALAATEVEGDFGLLLTLYRCPLQMPTPDI